MDEKKFRDTEAKYRELKEKHAGGEISTDQVKADLKKLMVQDETGTYWMLGGKSGKWYRHDGTQWQDADPYEKLAAADEEPPFELDSAVKISQDSEPYSAISSRESAHETASSREEKSARTSDVSDISYTPYATETSGNAETASDIDVGDIAYPSFATGSAKHAADKAVKIEKIEKIEKVEKVEEVANTEEAEDAYGAYGARRAYEADEAGKAFEAGDAQADYHSYGEYGDEAGQAHISLESYEADGAEMPGADDFLDSSQALDVTEPIKIGETGETGEDAEGTYESLDGYSTFELDSTVRKEKKAAVADDDRLFFERRRANEEDLAVEEESISALAADEGDEIDTKRFEYTVHRGDKDSKMIALEPDEQEEQDEQYEQDEREELETHEEFREPKVARVPTAQGTPAQEEPQDFITCGICKSRVPPYAVYCAFCGAHQKSLKQRTSLKPVKEEGELLIKSIKIASLMFFLGGLGLIIGVIVGAIFGVFKDFLADIATQLPMMLSETRGGPAGGLIFAAVGGIGGFIFSAVSAVILSVIYNLIAFIFGGIRFKIKR